MLVEGLKTKVEGQNSRPSQTLDLRHATIGVHILNVWSDWAMEWPEMGVISPCLTPLCRNSRYADSVEGWAR